MPGKRHKVILILGGARSGKSAFAQQWAEKSGKKVLFCATAEPLDADMAVRIRRHRRSRPAAWRTLEASTGLAPALIPLVDKFDTIIIDCITVLVANVMGNHATLKKQEAAVQEEITALVDLLAKRRANYLVVSNEAGLGVVPAYRSGRDYRDVLGRVNQQLAACADEVYFLISGIPVRIK